MHMTEIQFKLLSSLVNGNAATQREAAENAGLSLGATNKAIKLLREHGLVDEKLHTTDKGLEELAPYRVDNAVIMAAGLSSRFAPISYEKPKGVLKVRGEVLIERQIRQLKSAGISDITVVVGYKKEEFFYLADKLDVHIVVNEEYAIRNNHSSLYCVRNILANTYVCSSDNYFTENVFTPYVYRSYYSAEYVEGPTDEWCIKTGARDVITGVEMGGRDAWVMLGHVYFDKAFSKTFVSILESAYDKPETADMLWEDIYLKHTNELSMVMKRYASGIINEFDSLDQLRDFDANFLENIDSQIFDNITSTLKCKRNDIEGFEPIKQGITNLSCYFRANGGEFVYRHPGVGTEELVDRKSETKALELARHLGIDKTFVYENPDEGWKISRFVPDACNLDVSNDHELEQAMSLLRRLHDSSAQMDNTFDYYQEGKRYESLLKRRGPIGIRGYAELASNIERLNAYVAEDDWRKVPSHNDFFHLNILVDKSGNMQLIDWEYAGMADRGNDFGTFVVSSELDAETAGKALAFYLGRAPTNEERLHYFAHVALAGWCWYVWSLEKESSGDNVGKWLYVYYRYATQNLESMLEEYASTHS